MNTCFFHIDVNSAFLSWTAVEELKKGNSRDLRLIPSIIGGDQEKRHGIVLAKSILAKKYNIQTGEPISDALKKCPNLVIAPPNMQIYKQYSHALMEHLKNFSLELEKLSIDECFLDVSTLIQRGTDPIHLANSIRESIFEKFQYTVNIGISNKKVLAKMASDFDKPNKTHTLYSDEIKKKMWPLPVSDLYMCGKASNATLRKLEILTIGDLAKIDPEILELHLKSHGKLLWEYANGIDSSKLVTKRPDYKGIGNSITLQNDITDLKEIHAVLLSLSESVAKRLRASGKQASSVTVEIKYYNFISNTHQTVLDSPSDSTNVIYEISKNLLTEMWTKEPIRLLGIRCTKLTDLGTPIQLSLFDHQDYSTKKQKDLDTAIDSIRNKFGDSAIIRGSLLPQKKR